MKTALLVVIIVVVVLLVLVFALLPKLRANRQLRERERELHERRDRAAATHEAEADARARQAELAEQQAKLAAQESARNRAEADVLRTRADMHKEGLADSDLIRPEEREQFAGTSAVLDNPGPDPDAASRTPQAGTQAPSLAEESGQAPSATSERGDRYPTCTDGTAAEDDRPPAPGPA